MKLHQRPLFFFAAALILGIVTARIFGLHLRLILLLVPVVTAIAFSAVKEARSRWNLLLYVGVFAVGFLHTLSYLVIPSDDVSAYALGKKVHLIGTVCSDPTIGTNKGIWFDLQATKIRTYTGEPPVNGRVRVGILPPMNGGEIERAPMYGEEVALHGRLELPPESGNPGVPSMRDALLYRGVYCVITTTPGEVSFGRSARWTLPWVGSAFRASMRKKACSLFPSSYGNLLCAVILGDCAAVSAEVRDAFMRTGTMHIIVPSGYNLGVIAVVLGLIVNRLGVGRSWRHVLLILLVWVFVILAGGGPSITRGAIMITAVLASYLVKRAADPLNALFLSAILLLAANPLNLYEEGFRLTFASVLAIIVSLPLLHMIDEKVFGAGLRSTSLASVLIWPARTIVGSAAVSVVVCMAIWPIVASASSSVQILSVLANALSVVLVFLITIGGGLALLLGGISTSLALLVGVPTLFCLRTMLGLILEISAVPWCIVSVGMPSAALIAVYYLLLLGMGEYFARKSDASNKTICRP